MKVVIQRVSKAKLTCGEFKSEINKGLVVYFGAQEGDSEDKISKISKKIVNMRIFEDENGKMNKSVLDVDGEILCVSQFTLLADCSGGNRPSFIFAMKPELANCYYEKFLSELSTYGLSIKKGVFGGDMTIEQVNIGPCTIIYEL